jgi:Domain of unknown function (DUF4381)
MIDDIRDIRGLKAAPHSWVVPAIIVGVLLVLALCAYCFWWRRRDGRHAALTLSQRTLARLDAIRPLMRTETARAFGIAASELIRDYIEKRFQVVATQRTTEEFLQALLRDPTGLQGPDEALARHRNLLDEFLHQCDFVKFGGDSLPDAALEPLYQSARQFVLETSEATA